MSDEDLLKKLSGGQIEPYRNNSTSIKEFTDFLDTIWKPITTPIMHTGRPGAKMCARNLNAAIRLADENPPIL